MFNTPTVFVLGAGASWHYGYPTGEGLVKKVVEKAVALERYFDFGVRSNFEHLPDFLAERSGALTPARRWRALQNEAKALATRLSRVNPTLIDYFLKQNADLHEIGKLAIAMVIFDCELAYFQMGANPNRRALQQLLIRRGQLPAGSTLDPAAFDDDWLRFVLYKLTARCEVSEDLLRNELTFVTFNYDTSLEQRLFAGLSNISLFEEADIRAFLGEGRVLHVYGKVRERIGPLRTPVSTALTESGSRASLLAVKTMFDLCHHASLGIRTIDGPEKESDAAALGAANLAIGNAGKIFVLGYGFDESNSERIGLTSLVLEGGPNRSIFFTNYGGHNRVSVAAGRALADRSDAFLQGPGFASGLPHRFEMSTKNVYDALNEDFESLETD